MGAAGMKLADLPYQAAAGSKTGVCEATGQIA